MSRLSVALRHYFIGVVVGIGLMTMGDESPALGVALTVVGILTQCVMQWRAGNADLRAKDGAS